MMPGTSFDKLRIAAYRSTEAYTGFWVITFAWLVVWAAALWGFNA